MDADPRAAGACFGFPSPSKPFGFGLVIGHFYNAAAGVEPLLHTALALRSALLAVSLGGHRDEKFDAEALCKLSGRAFAALLRSLEDTSQLATVVDGHRSFCGLMHQLSRSDRVNEDVLLDVVDKIAIAANDLDSLHRRDAISQRGAPLDRALALGKAEAASPSGSTLQ